VRHGFLLASGQRVGGSYQSNPAVQIVRTKMWIVLTSLKLTNFDGIVRSRTQHLLTALAALRSICKTSAQLRRENLALRQQIAALRRSAPKRLNLKPANHIF
jgi:hypothetical protein